MSEVNMSEATDDSKPIEYMLTTYDNPFNPFTRFDEWYAYDVRLGYNTSSFLATIAKLSNETSETDQSIAIQDAIDEIVSENVSGMWRKVTEESSKSDPRIQS